MESKVTITHQGKNNENKCIICVKYLLTLTRALMLKTPFLKRKKLELKATPGENIRDAIIKAGLKAAEESGYAAGNTTERLVELASKAGPVIDRGTELVGGGETAGAIGRIIFKTTKDIARGDGICTGLCLISGTCETIAFGCSTIKILPLRGKLYVCAKIVSKGCMAYRNLCAGEAC